MQSYDVVESGKPLKRFIRETPEPSGTEVLLRVLAAGVCHSDVHIWEGQYDLGGGKKLLLSERGMKLPLTMGHETVGEVVAVGPSAQGVATGDRRLVFPWIGCGSCGVCRRGDEQLCLRANFVGAFRPGGYADHILVPHSRYLLDIGDLEPVEVAPFACSGLTAFGALKRLGPIVNDEPVVIIGVGGLGLMCLNLLAAIGGRGGVVVDIDPAKRAAALAAGALAAIDANAPDASDRIVAAAGGSIWAAVDFVGSSQSADLVLKNLAKGGTLVLVGLFGGEMTISLPLIPMRAISIIGSYVGNLEEAAELMQLVRSRRVKSIPINRRPLDRINETLEDLRDGKLVGRAVLTP